MLSEELGLGRDCTGSHAPGNRRPKAASTTATSGRQFAVSIKTVLTSMASTNILQIFKRVGHDPEIRRPAGSSPELQESLSEIPSLCMTRRFSSKDTFAAALSFAQGFAQVTTP